MSSRGIYDNNQPTWIPYITNRDCSQGICSLNCPQFCYFTVPPPPPVDFPEVNSSGPFNFSPLMIAVIGILASAILLVSYYTLISKYCRNTSSSRGGARVSRGGSGRERWFAPSNNGLDEAVIQSIAVCKYKKGVGYGSNIEGTCSVCLSEFEEGESVRLLPKCTHPFHVPCIDTWLRSHPSCPLCRSNIIFPMLPSPPVLTENINPHSSPVAENGAETEVSEAIIFEVREEGLRRPIRRSFSTGNCWCQTVADVLREDDGDADVENQINRDSDATKSSLSEMCKSGHNRGITRVSVDRGKCSSEMMKRSLSSGRLVRKNNRDNPIVRRMV